MDNSKVRGTAVLGVVFVTAVAAVGCSVKGIQTPNLADGGKDAGGRLDAATRDAPPASGGGGAAGAPAGGGGAVGGATSIGGSSGGATAIGGSVAGGARGGATGGSSGATGGSIVRLDAGVPDAARDTATGGTAGVGGTGGATGGTTARLDAGVPDRPDARDTATGGTAGAAGTGGATGGTTAKLDASVPDAPPDTPVGGSGGGGTGGTTATGGTGGSSSTAPLPVITEFTASPSPVTAGKTTTLAWVVTGAATLSINQGIGVVTGDSKVVTVPGQATTYILTYTLTATNSTGDSVTKAVDVSVVRLAITNFTVSPQTINAGASTTLTPIFVGSAATITSPNDVVTGTITSGSPVEVSPLVSTTYTLTVSNELGDFTTRTVAVTVLPVITSLTAASTSIVSGSSTTLTAIFAGGTGLVDNSVGAVTTGVAKTTDPLTADTTFTLTVTNAAGDFVTKTVTVAVFVPDADLPDTTH